jgi:hypothetical protein
MTQLQEPIPAITRPDSDGHQRLAGAAGITAVAAGAVTIPLIGTVPVLGDGPAQVAAYFASDGGPHRAAVIIGALLAIPIALFLVGVYRALAETPFWATAFLYGAVMMSATAGLKEALYALAVRQGDTGLDPVILQVINDGSQIAGATLGAWMALTIGAVAVVAVRRRTGWYAWLTSLVAAVAAVSVIDTISLSTGGALASAAFGGFIVWLLTSAIVMLRRPLMH